MFQVFTVEFNESVFDIRLLVISVFTNKEEEAITEIHLKKIVVVGLFYRVN